MRVVIYARLSLDLHGDQLGVERQVAECRDYCNERGWEVAAVHVDNDISATKGKLRPGFEAALEQPHDGIVVWHTDRLVRVTHELERVIDRGIPVYALKAGHFDLSTPAGRAVARTITAWATYEGEQKGERQRSSNRQRAADGKPWWPRAPLGYTKTGELVPDQAEALRVCYERLLAGAALTDLARYLNERGHLTSYGLPWRSTSLRPVLLNPRNAGLRQYQGEIIGPGNWPAIVDEPTWRSAVRLLESPSRRTGGGGRNPRSLLTGIAVCDVCDSTVRVGWRGKRGGGGRLCDLRLQGRLARVAPD